MYFCPVCGYSGLRRPPVDHTICPSCGTQFGYSDAGPDPLPEKQALLRKIWVGKGAQWHSRYIPQPFLWNPWDQLIKANLMVDAPWVHGAVVTETTTYVHSAPEESGFGPMRLKVA